MRHFVLVALLAGRLLAAVEAVDSVRMTVSDLERATAFYTQVLGFEPVSANRLRLGDEFIELNACGGAGRPIPADSRSHDRWFQHIAIVVGDMDQAYRVLVRHKVRPLSAGPQTLPAWNKKAGGIKAFYFADPDNHPLEILWFPPRKGDLKWQRKDRLFLGIDHTAIVVAGTETSLKFYRDRLGLRVAGESLNYGVEQERLNNVAGARLRITALRAPSGPGVEFLEYLNPRDGRRNPSDDTPCDLVRRETVMHDSGAPAGALRDPDGHVVRLAPPPR
ncbi:MAG: VOC family protein [Acidobacteria bacterium]|nr:VOC family protein [Acidobacteriota bacterium]